MNFLKELKCQVTSKVTRKKNRTIFVRELKIPSTDPGKTTILSEDRGKNGNFIKGSAKKMRIL